MKLCINGASFVFVVLAAVAMVTTRPLPSFVGTSTCVYSHRQATTSPLFLGLGDQDEQKEEDAHKVRHAVQEAP